MRKTVSNLSRLLKTSRPRIYRHLKHLGIEKRGQGAEYTDDEWGRLVESLKSDAIDANYAKSQDGQPGGGATAGIMGASGASPRRTAGHTAAARGGGGSGAGAAASANAEDCADGGPASGDIVTGSHISGVETATLRERLKNAKQEYDYNRRLVDMFQSEIDSFYLENGRTFVVMKNNAVAAIPAIANLDKYIKLNISLAKLIGDIEADLDLEVDSDGDNVFG